MALFSTKNSESVSIATFHWADDYGAMLQTYGLKVALKSMGVDAEIIPYAPYKCVGRYWLIPYYPTDGSSRLDIRKLISGVRRGDKYNIKHLRTYVGRRRNMRKFRRKFLTSALAYRAPGKIDFSKYSRVFVGSDQVWNPVLTVGFDKLYMGAVNRPEDCHFVSYAASFGGSSLDSSYEADFSKYLCNFKTVSMREKSAIPYVQKFCDKPVRSAIDPTLLNGPDTWEHIMKTPKENGYILLYHTAYVKDMDEYVSKLAERTGKQVIRIGSSLRQNRTDFYQYDFRGAAGPQEFLGYFHNADYVVTNSFHGTVFATLFHRKMAVFGYKDRSTRMTDFLDSVGLSNKFIKDGISLSDGGIDEPIDWANVDGLLDSLRNESFDYIRDCLRG